MNIDPDVKTIVQECERRGFIAQVSTLYDNGSKLITIILEKIRKDEDKNGEQQEDRTLLL